MTKQERIDAAMQAADSIYAGITHVGAVSYRTPVGITLLWFPWDKQVIDLADARAVGHALVMTGYMPAGIAMRDIVVSEVISSCQDEAIEIKHATHEIKSLAHAKRLY
jgi:hypothetical protein